MTTPITEETAPAPVFNLADPATMAAMAAAAQAAHAAAASMAAKAPAEDPRIREVDGGTITLCPGGILVFTADGTEDRAPEAQVLDQVLGKQCTGLKGDGTRCRRTVQKDSDTCGQNHAGSVT